MYHSELHFSPFSIITFRSVHVDKIIHQIHAVKLLCSIQLWIYHLCIHQMIDLKHFKIKSEIIDYLESKEENISISLANIGI